MEIRVCRIGTEAHEDREASDATNVYRVTDNGREFTVTYRSHSHGGNLGLAGRQGFLYTDTETDTVRRQVITVGLTCGVVIESDEAVKGLSPWAIRGVVMAERSGETREITITGVREAGFDQSVILVEGKAVDLHKYLCKEA